MLVAISNPTQVPDEAALINQLFDEGLKLFHLRKPDYSFEELEALLNDIDPAHHPKIALHQHHEMSKKFDIKRLHYVEHKRLEESPESLSAKVNEGFILTTSLHDIADYYTLPEQFAYAFLGPVFGSISKTNYKAMESNKRLMEQPKTKVKLIALGGITEVNGHLPFEWGFDGVAILGTLWEDTTKTIESFIKIKAACNTIAQ